MWVILYSDFTTKVWNYESNMRCYCVHFSKSNEFTSLHDLINRLRADMPAYIYTHRVYIVHSYSEYVSPFEFRSPMHNADSCGSLLYAPKLVCTWYRLRDRMTRFNALSLSVPLDLLLASFSSSCIRPLESPRWSRESPRAHLIRFFVPRIIYLLSHDSISRWLSRLCVTRIKDTPIRRYILSCLV